MEERESKRCMSPHYAGSYPSGWNVLGMTVSVYRVPSHSAFRVSQWISLVITVVWVHGWCRAIA